MSKEVYINNSNCVAADLNNNGGTINVHHNYQGPDPDDAISPEMIYRVAVRLPHDLKLNFKGREKELKQIRELFWPSGSQSEPPAYGHTSRKVISLTGLSGSGKTETAVKYAYSHEEKYSAIVWIDATNETEIITSARKAIELIIKNYPGKSPDKKYLRIAHTLGLDEHVQGITSEERLMEVMDGLKDFSSDKALNNWLSQDSNHNWLLIIDNYDEPKSYHLDKLIPNGGFGHILITSRRSDPYKGHKINLSRGIENNKAIELLLDISGRPITEDGSPDEYRSAVEIVDLVGGLPLAIESIGAYLAKIAEPIQDYLQKLKKEPERLFEPVEPDAVRAPRNSIGVIWEIAFSKLTPEARQAIFLFSLMGSGNIHRRFAEERKRILQEQKEFPEEQNLETIVYKEVGELLSFSFVNWDGDNYFMHPLLRQWARNHQKNNILQNSRAVIEIITRTLAFDNERDFKQSAYEHHILPHINQCFDIFTTQLASVSGLLDQETKKIAYKLARVYTNLGDFEKSSTIYKRSLEGIDLRITTLDTDMMDSFGVNLNLQGQWDEALRWCEKAKSKTDLDGNSAESLVIGSHIASIYTQKGEYSNAIARYRQILKQQKEPQGNIETRQQLARVLEKAAEYSEALTLLTKVREEKNSKLGEEHPSTLETVSAIARVLQHQGEYDESLRYHKDVYEKRKKCLGDGHYLTIDTIYDIAGLYERLGKYEDALTNYKDALKGLEAIFVGEKDHRWMLSTRYGIANILMRQKKYKEAEEAYKKVYEGYKKHQMLVDGAYPVAISIARALRDQKHYKAAWDWCMKAQVGLRDKNGSQDFILAAELCAATIREDEGKYKKALVIYTKALEVYDKAHGKDHAETLKVRLSIGEVLYKQRRLKKALRDLKLAEEGLEKALGKDHDQTKRATEWKDKAQRKLDNSHWYLLLLCYL
ncbi:hypothetical protein H072_10984 [Dactylellina haptotyla CBS 200.50]|uniref:NB-ARC domain-containing protein n=1 Tax=Dactylellina haptotyla (strain CBS 200.50) TaxID=1284197 RepID=S7ZYU7_DACHA|nr:hypothetical protein H072_10984 [Dactylellina haptotyla CBS 200.50]